LSLDYQKLVSDRKALEERNKNAALLIPGFVADPLPPLPTWDEYKKERTERIFDVMGQLSGGADSGDGQGAGGVDVSDDELGALFNDFVGGQ
jgi:hypothetical protein